MNRIWGIAATTVIFFFVLIGITGILMVVGDVIGDVRDWWKRKDP